MSMPNTPETWTPAELDQLWMLRTIHKLHDANLNSFTFMGTENYYTG
jgi:hypothetical protein